jgi:hypothetical protein
MLNKNKYKQLKITMRKYKRGQLIYVACVLMVFLFATIVKLYSGDLRQFFMFSGDGNIMSKFSMSILKYHESIFHFKFGLNLFIFPEFTIAFILYIISFGNIFLFSFLAIIFQFVALFFLIYLIYSELNFSKPMFYVLIGFSIFFLSILFESYTSDGNGLPMILTLYFFNSWYYGTVLGSFLAFYLMIKILD